MKTNIIEHGRVPSYRHALCVMVIVIPLIALCAQAQVDAGKPGPKHEQMRLWEGEWTYEGTQQETQFGPQGNFKGKMTNRLILKGFVLECDWVEDEAGITHGLAGRELHYYDAAKDHYMVTICDNFGGVCVIVETYRGNAVTGRGIQTDVKGTTSMVRTSRVLDSSGDKNTSKWELSVDEGKTWLPWFQLTATRVKK